ncbi:pyrimidine reductase family protein [Curtobacterium sp. MCBD17_035]|uniref:pyrimidine reductase family protein n=1 Tax=Curtobacterium sp. MCBD17_035 TaxID=2175673 RepID=UPI0015E88F6E|nr:pyrimidine reductase family protein [Curtobacterium sp. MCBD17_035]WIB67650.1 pyrimidine reductase family protein [Curtobacterium sp. MCBD17_035]
MSPDQHATDEPAAAAAAGATDAAAAAAGATNPAAAAGATDAAAIEQLFPAAGPGPLDDDALLALYGREARHPSPTTADGWVRVNFVSSLDGSATAEGVSGGLGGPADLRVFDLLRRLADVVLVAAGTVRNEGYGPMRLHDADVAWRRARDLPDHPAFAIVSGSLALDAASRVFTEAPVRPVVLTHAEAPADRRAALAAVADVVDCGADAVDVAVVRRALVERGLAQIHCEGGPGLLGALVAADAVDELCLTVSPVLEGGDGPRIARGGAGQGLRSMRLAHVLRAGDMLLTRYRRP